MRFHRWTVVAVAVCLAAACAGCGTRLHLGNGAGLTSGGSQSLAGSGLGGQAGAGQAGSGAGAASGAALGSAGAGLGGAGGGSSGGGTSLSGVQTGAGSGGGTGGAGAGRVPGVTASTLTIGFTYSDTATFKQFASACPACATFGDQTYHPALYAQLADDINSRGGVLGRKVAFSGYAYDSSAAVSDSSQLNSTVQAACQNFSTDHPAFAVVSSFGSIISPCLTKSGISTMTPSGGIGDTVDAATLASSLLYASGASETDNYEPVYVSRLAAQHYFSGWDPTQGAPGPQPLKIGLVSFSDPWLARTDQLLEKALKAAGYQIADHIWYSAELDVQSQNVQNAILKFRSEGVTHVMGTGANGLFMYESVGQNYYPRYAYQTGSISDTDANSQKGLRGSIGEGVFPVADIDPSAGEPNVGPMQAKCEQIATKAGIGWQSNQGYHADVLSVCAAVWDLMAAAAKGGILTAPGLAGGFNNLGTIGSAVSFGETWSAGRHASANTMADFQYMPACSCFKYTGVRTPF
ncbi:MAG TPA: hypothetical protein VE990_01170 [Acidimicrobiales bacterium]|nr:hypothetical protein [Acidimicrobiales bacterium]